MRPNVSAEPDSVDPGSSRLAHQTSTFDLDLKHLAEGPGLRRFHDAAVSVERD
jgi:hypothetical protein